MTDAYTPEVLGLERLEDIPGFSAWFGNAAFSGSDSRNDADSYLSADSAAVSSKSPNARVVLMQPEIPENTGNIARTCACTGSSLTLVDPLGFQLSERHLKRAGLDYWDDVAIDRLPATEDFFAVHGSERFFLFTGHTDRLFNQVEYQRGDWLVFGRESRGIDEEVLARYPDRCVRIPMAAGQRSLNLSNSVAIAVYELLRQTGYPQLT